MPVLGPSPSIETLSTSLTPELLVRLVADLLAERGHYDIRITDGPGDGGRDIHSLTVSGTRHLTQCKHKEDVTKTASSADLSELPMGLYKLVYPGGLFVTNGRISPQAKREYLDNYPDKQLEWLDGEALLRELCHSPVLVGLWVSGTELAKANATMIFPFIVRDLATDRACSVAGDETALQRLRLQVQARLPGLECLVDPNSHTHFRHFDPYRPPSRRTLREGMSQHLNATEVLLRGDVCLSEVNTYAEALSQIVPEVLSSIPEFPANYAIRLGSPQIAPLSGTYAGARFDLYFSAETYWCAEGHTNREAVMIRPTRYSGSEPDRTHGWIERSDARVSESSAVRLYHPILNACVDCSIVTRPSLEQRLIRETAREAVAVRWDESLFAIVPADILENLLSHQHPPDGHFLLGDVYLCCWLHPDLRCGAVPLHEDALSAGAELVAKKLGFVSDDPAPSLEDVLQSLQHHEQVRLLQPRLARHLLAFLESDPFPSLDFQYYRTCDVLIVFDRIPSPLFPGCRKLTTELVWVHSNMTEERYNDPALPTLLREGLTEATVAASGYDASPEVNTERSKDFAAITLSFNAVNPTEVYSSTDEILRALEVRVQELLPALQSVLDGLLPGWKLATKWYWQRRFNVDLDPPVEGTGKIHAWYHDAAGNLVGVLNSERGFREVMPEEAGYFRVPERFDIPAGSDDFLVTLLAPFKKGGRAAK